MNRLVTAHLCAKVDHALKSDLPLQRNKQCHPGGIQVYTLTFTTSLQ